MIIPAKKTNSQFLKEVFEKVGNEYIPFSEYINAKSKVIMKHVKCSHIYKVTPDDFLNGGTRCPKCFGNIRKTTEQFKEEVYQKHGDGYIVLGSYSNNKTPLRMKHNTDECQHEFMVTPDAFLRGSHCNRCSIIKRSGIFHYKYNFNLTPEEREKRDMFNGEIKKWRNKIYERDDYTCQVCRNRGGKLNAHHLNSWDTHHEERFDLNNGITLCEDCHKDFHVKYGYGNNDRTQFIEYISN